MENSSHKNKYIDRKYLNNMQKNSLLELEKYLMELKDRSLKDREVKIKREIGELFFKPTIVPIDGMDKFEQKEMKKIRSIKCTWYDWLINYIPVPMRKSVGGFEDKNVSLFKQTHPNNLCIGETRN